MINIKQTDLVNTLRVVGELITNRIVALDTSYLKISSVEGKQYVSGFGSQQSIILKVGEDEVEDYSVNVDYTKLIALVNYMNEDVKLDANDDGVLTTDGSVETYLKNIMSDNTDIEDIKEILSKADELKESGFEVDRIGFYDTLRYLRGIQEREERTDIETGVMFAKDYAYVVSELYAARQNFGLGENLVLDGHVTRVILPMLDMVDEDKFTIAREQGVTYFYVGDNVYEVDGLTDDIAEQYQGIFNVPETENEIRMEKAEYLRVLGLTKVLTDALEPDIIIEVKEGNGKIHTGTQDGDKVESEFKTDTCGDVNFRVSVESMLAVISKLPKDVAKELELDIVLETDEQETEMDLLHLKHELGECIFSIERAD